MEHYSQKQCHLALLTATDIINTRTKACPTYTRGTNDCVALLAEYDRALRGGKTKAHLKFEWISVRDFIVKLRRAGYTMPEYMKRCGYEIVTNNKPKTGDVAFEQGAMIAGLSGWISTTNEGVAEKRQMMFLERRLSFIARPIRS